jgi:hypothetical protein
VLLELFLQQAVSCPKSRLAGFVTPASSIT